MILLSEIRNNPEGVISRLKIKNFDAAEIVERLQQVDQARRHSQKSLDDSLARSNSLAKEIGELFKSGQPAMANELKQQTLQLKHESKALQEQLDALSQEQNELLVQLPNIPHELVPAGKSSEDNLIVIKEGEIREFSPKWFPIGILPLNMVLLILNGVPRSPEQASRYMPGVVQSYSGHLSAFSWMRL
jgi:seryl-tRNA synthetase